MENSYIELDHQEYQKIYDALSSINRIYAAGNVIYSIALERESDRVIDLVDGLPWYRFSMASKLRNYSMSLARYSPICFITPPITLTQFKESTFHVKGKAGKTQLWIDEKFKDKCTSFINGSSEKEAQKHVKISQVMICAHINIRRVRCRVHNFIPWAFNIEE